VISTFSNYTLANIFNEENRQMWVHVITHSGVWRMSVIFALSWFGGALVFCLLEENWSYLDALYFAFATQLTIGFGDLVPQTTVSHTLLNEGNLLLVDDLIVRIFFFFFFFF
jgi:potassium channel subfamily K